ncbi:MAG: class I SAM-dependent methyltransferase [Phycisphaerae bacterium]
MIDRLGRKPEPELMDLPNEAEAYAAADFSDVNQRFVDRLLAQAGLPERAAVLDLGAGPGDIPIRLARLRPDWRIVAADAAAAMLRIARQAVSRAGLSQSIFVVCADAKRTPFATDVFDGVISNSILHHVADTASFWGEVGRVAKRGGFVLMRDLYRPESDAAAGRIVQAHASGESELLQEEFHRSLLSAYTVDEVREQLSRAGLDALDVVTVTDRHLDVFGRVA